MLSSLQKFPTCSQYVTIAICVIIIISALALGGVITQREVSGGILALAGTFIGAFSAFKLNDNKEQIKSENEKNKSLNRAFFILSR